MYKITKYSFDKVDQLNKKLGKKIVQIKPSKLKNKKIAVYVNDKKVSDIGDNRYKDYPTYTKQKGIKFADKRRELYWKRHANEKIIKDDMITPSAWAKWILW